MAELTFQICAHLPEEHIVHQLLHKMMEKSIKLDAEGFTRWIDIDKEADPVDYILAENKVYDQSLLIRAVNAERDQDTGAQRVRFRLELNDGTMTVLATEKPA